MSVGQAQIRIVEEIYQLVWTAVANKQPTEAATRGGLDYSAPHRMGRKGSFACCVISTAAIARPGLQASVSFTNWHCVALEKLSRVKVLEASDIQPRIIRVPGPAWLKSTSKQRINPSAIHKKDIETVAQAVAGQASFAGS